MFRFIGFYDYTVLLTYLSLLSSVIGMSLASRGSFTGAVLCLMFSGLCDAFDGIVARTKKNRSEDEKGFGIQIDSLVDVVAFGIFPALICYYMSNRSVWAIACGFVFVLCAVIRLAFFNVLEGKRQQAEGGANKYYRGLPVTSISMIFPFFYLFRTILLWQIFVAMMCVLLVVVAFLFVFDFSVKKIDWLKPFRTGKNK